MLASLWLVGATSGAAETVTLVVSADGGAQYQTIQSAIDAAPAGAVIYVGPGEYPERLVITQPVTLQGAGADQTKIARTFQLGSFANDPRVQIAERNKSMSVKTQMEAIGLSDQSESYLQKIRDHAITMLVQDADGVVIRDMKISSPGEPERGSSIETGIVTCRGSKVTLENCIVSDSPGSGICISEGSEVQIANTLVAGLWSEGIIVGERGRAKAGAVSIRDSEIRNCHHYGVIIRPGHDDTVVERCRISGAAWHGLRYDNASPTVKDCLIYNNARSGIYASGRTQAVVSGNLILGNQQNGISCWIENADRIIGNSIVKNEREGLMVLGGSIPQVTGNIFCGHATAISRGRIGGDPTQKVGEPNVVGNMFWDNIVDDLKSVPGTSEGTWAEMPVRFTEGDGNVVADPRFVSAAQGDYALAQDSPAKGFEIGVARPLDRVSPWPLLPEEQAMIPVGDTRDTDAWRISSND